MKLTLNLASRTYLNRRAIYAIYGASTLVLALFLIFNLWQALRSQTRIGNLEGELASRDQIVSRSEQAKALGYSPQAYAQLTEEIDFSNHLLIVDSFRWTRLLDRLEVLMPDQVAIGSIQPNYREGSLNLNGFAKELKDLQNFLDNLIHAPDFSDVHLMQQSRLKGKDIPVEREQIGFSVVLKGAF